MSGVRGEQRRGIAGWLLWAAFGVILGLASCAPAPVPPRPVAAPPEWRIGDRWRHAWTAGAEAGTKTSEVLEVRELGGVRYYVLRIDSVHRYYTLDLHWAANIVELRVAARAVPPQPWFMWPLEVGRRWEYQGRYEDQERQEQVRESYTVLGVEQVQVPAGTFWAFKVGREGAGGSSDQYWYAPDIGWYVKWVGRRGNDQFQEVLVEFVRGSRSAPAPPPAERPGGARE